MVMTFGAWSVRSLYRACSQISVLKDLSNSKLDRVGVWEVRLEGAGKEPAGEYTFFYWKRMRTMNWYRFVCE
jgi:hypothetical protein